MLISDWVKIKWSYSNRKYYEPIGYIFTKAGDEFLVKVEDLAKGSKTSILTLCDYCLEKGIQTLIDQDFYTYNNKQNQLINKDCCKKCRSIKIKESNKIKYGVECTMQIKEFAEKCVQSQRLDFNIIIELFKNKNYELLTTENEYKNASTKNLKYICNKHKSKGIQETSYHSAELNKDNCEYCAGEKQSKRQKLPLTYVESIYLSNDLILLEYDYKKSSIPMKCYCINHPDKIQSIRLANLLNGQGCKYCGIEKRSRENHPNWNQNKTDEDRLISRYSQKEYREWRKKIYEEDNYTCQVCGQVGGKLNAHHKYNYGNYPQYRFDINNGVTLCESCHINFHIIYGRKDNTPRQFEGFRKNLHFLLQY